MNANLEDIVAVRELRLKTDDNAIQEVKLIIGKPFQLPDSSDYGCNFQIEGIGNGEVQQTYGVDAVQAIELAIKMAEAKLSFLDRHHDKQLAWQDGTRYFGEDNTHQD